MRNINRNTGTMATFRSQRDAEITRAIYRRVPVLKDDAADVEQMEGVRGKRYLSLYEAKMMHQFTHRWATYERNDKSRARRK